MPKKPSKKELDAAFDAELDTINGIYNEKLIAPRARANAIRNATLAKIKACFPGVSWMELQFHPDARAAHEQFRKDYMNFSKTEAEEYRAVRQTLNLKYNHPINEGC